MGMDISRGRWKNLEVTVKSMRYSFPRSRQQPWLVGLWRSGVCASCDAVLFRWRLVYRTFLEIDSLSILQKVSLEMKAERSFGRGMDLPAGRNGVLALSAGVRIRQV